MTSILTNASAMSAVSSLAVVQRALGKTESQITTGMRVAKAQDNPAYWSIATSMKSRVGQMQAVSDGLDLTSSIIATTNAALTTILGLTQGIAKDLVTAQTAGVDRATVQTDIGEKQKQIVSAAQAASFNGVNWLVTQATGTDTNREDVNVHDTQAHYLDPTRNYSIPIDEVFTNTDHLTQTLGSTVTTTSTSTTTALGNAPAHSVGFAQTSTSTTNSSSGDPSAYQDVSLMLSLGNPDVVNLHSIEQFWNFSGTSQGSAFEDYSDVPSFQYGGSPASTQIGDPYINYGLNDTLDSQINTSGGGIDTVLNLDISQASDSDIASLSTGVNAAIQRLIAGQSFLGGLQTTVDGSKLINASIMDALTSGIGSLVDADMNLASTRLRALQTQQTLGVHALGIANSNSQIVLKLFRGYTAAQVSR